MGKRKEERERIAAIIERLIQDTEAGNVHYWDAQHCPTMGERKGRVHLLRWLLREVGRKEAKSPGGE